MYIYLDGRILFDRYTDRGMGHIRVRFEGRKRQNVDIPMAH